MVNYNEEKCPACQTSLAPIIYGFANPDLVDLARKEIIALGGFKTQLDNRYCYSCHETFFIPVND